ncbi:MAG: NADH-quinone oxidoreductase subunit D [Candidatus Heimdallarchaeota archaeon]|nr:NADH-quinone oxidoreductase subunit D [Candidatus Heimdallarchaeota archaeon]
MNGILKEWFKVLKTGWNLLTTKPITYNFPPDMPITEETRGRHILDIEKCRSCSLCSRVCPNQAIEMVERENPDPSAKKKTVKYPQIDFSKCCFCGLCVEACPTEALQMTNASIMVAPEKSQFLYPPEKLVEPPDLKHPEPAKIKNASSWARSRSLWIINYFTGCCFIEAVPWVGSGFDMERFGLIVARNPRMADVLLIGGYVTKKTVKRILRIYEQMPAPKFVIALGNCPMTGGTYWDSFNTINRIDDYIPVDIWIVGCPPRPEAIGFAIVSAINHIQNGYTGKEEKVGLKDRSKLVPYREEAKLKPGEVLVPFGPQHPASGNFNLKLVLNGEMVSRAKPEVGYLHRGFEKLMEYRTWYQNVMIIQRICVLDGASYEVGYVSAIEKIANIEIPKRAKYLRTIQLELSRIQSHLLNMGLIGGATGFHTMQMVSWGDREKILYLLDKLTGARIYHIYNTPGGVFRDLPDDFQEETFQTIKDMRKRMKEYDDLFIHNPTLQQRTVGLGKIPSKVAINYDITGPNLRASGINFDVRKNSPYAAYDELDFEIPTFEEGDAYHRILCRRLEIDQSLNIIEQALKKMPKGPVRTKFGSYRTSIPRGEAISFLESARGELAFHLVSNGSNKPQRAKVRGPTFDPILVLLPELVKGNYLADVPVIYWSLDNCPADHDR